MQKPKYYTFDINLLYTFLLKKYSLKINIPNVKISFVLKCCFPHFILPITTSIYHN